MKTLLEFAPPGKESRLLVVTDGDSKAIATFIKDLVNHCAEHRLKVSSVETEANYFTWTDDSGSEIEVNNLRRNKAMLVISPA